MTDRERWHPVPVRRPVTGVDRRPEGHLGDYPAGG